MATTSKSNHFLSGKKILVAGACMGGLSFVLSLHKNWDASTPLPEIRIVDSDTRDLSINRETYSLLLSGTDKDGGLLVCRDLDLLDTMTARAVKGVDTTIPFHIWDKSFKSLISMRHKPYDNLPTPSVRIRKPEMRTILVEAVEALDSISWSTSASNVEKLPDGRLSVTLASQDGTETVEECDFLIAADGSNSKVREHLRPNDTLEYAGCVQLGGCAEFPEGGAPEPLNERMGLTITGDGIGSFFSHVAPGRLLWGLSKWEKDGPRDGYDKTDPKAFEALMAECREMAKGIAEPMATILSKTANPELSFVLPARDKQPFGHGGDLPENVVFIGDANHTVSSFGGNGANLAIHDGWDLAAELCKADSANGAVAAYDKVALPRANKTLKESRDRMGHCHTSGWKWTMLRTAISAGSLFVSK